MVEDGGAMALLIAASDCSEGMAVVGAAGVGPTGVTVLAESLVVSTG